MLLCRRNRKPLCFIFLLFLFSCCIIILAAALYVLSLALSYTFGLSDATIFHAQFQVYILTHDCGRFTSNISANFDHNAVILVPDSADIPDCAALNHPQLHPSINQVSSKDAMLREKYAQVLDHCRAGQKMKCLILEDDVVFLHTAERTRELLVKNTLTLFNTERDAFDCTKRGLGWFRSTHTGNGSQCRIYSKTTVPCITGCLRDTMAKAQLDTGLGACQATCGLLQKRFLLVVHSGLGSTMGRQEKQEQTEENGGKMIGGVRHIA